LSSFSFYHTSNYRETLGRLELSSGKAAPARKMRALALKAGVKVRVKVGENRFFSFPPSSLCTSAFTAMQTEASYSKAPPQGHYCDEVVRSRYPHALPRTRYIVGTTVVAIAYVMYRISRSSAFSNYPENVTNSSLEFPRTFTEPNCFFYLL